MRSVGVFRFEVLVGGCGRHLNWRNSNFSFSSQKKKLKIQNQGFPSRLLPVLKSHPHPHAASSSGAQYSGVQIHHKLYDAESQAPHSLRNQTLLQLPNQTKKVQHPMILLHGFGASVFSWNRVMKPLAELMGSKVLAFDRPAFGLTSRVNISSHSSPATEDRKPLNPYSMAFSVLATLYFIDFLAAEKAILVGHSAGSLTAVNSYFEAPERVAALILVAPAILAPLIVHKVVQGNQLGRENQMEEDSSDSSNLRNPFQKLSKNLLKFAKSVAQAMMQMVKGMAVMLNSLYKKLLSAILRSAFAVMLVRIVIDKFGIAAIRNAWYNSSQVTEHVLYGYTKPLRTKGWDRALVEYTAAMLTDTEAESKPPLAKRLHEISCPVLIVTGDSDRIVPSWNAQRLAQAIPGSYLEVIKHCGHLPHEEKVEEFTSVVEKFLQRFFGESEKQCLQAVS
uniref:AB hydrolase-1 domain-containing protein n=1 Tax=Fagus sylvatica TaxID=28930 RepID=A0A2N9EI23_FAGSY